MASSFKITEYPEIEIGGQVDARKPVSLVERPANQAMSPPPVQNSPWTVFSP